MESYNIIIYTDGGNNVIVIEKWIGSAISNGVNGANIWFNICLNVIAFLIYIFNIHWCSFWNITINPL